MPWVPPASPGLPWNPVLAKPPLPAVAGLGLLRAAGPQAPGGPAPPTVGFPEAALPSAKRGGAGVGPRFSPDSWCPSKGVSLLKSPHQAPRVLRRVSPFLPGVKCSPLGSTSLFSLGYPFCLGGFTELTPDAAPSPPELWGDQASAHLLTVFQGGVRPFCLCSRPNTVIVFGYGGEVSDRGEGGLRHSRSFHMQGSCPCSALHILSDATALWVSPAPWPVAY